MSGIFDQLDPVFWYGLNNLVVAMPIVLLAWWTQTKFKSPFLSYLLWLLVLLKLVTPPFLSLPVLSFESGDPLLVATLSEAGEARAPGLDWKALLVGIWAIGSVAVVAWSVYCISRFNRLLHMTSAPAGEALQLDASASARRIGLSKTPILFETRANVPPMVWWIGGRVRIYLPTDLVSSLAPEQIRLIVAHELGHVRLFHHAVRWFEWLISVSLWWNPLAWWARKNLRVNEELCCDAFVVAKLGLPGRSYARSLLSALESLASPAIRPPAMATGINGGGFIERRIEMIMSQQPKSRASRMARYAILASAALLLPLGFSLAQDQNELQRVEDWLESGVNSAFLTQEQAEFMMRALRQRDTNVRRQDVERAEMTAEILELERALEEVLLVAETRPLTEAETLELEELQMARAQASNRIRDVQIQNDVRRKQEIRDRLEVQRASE